MKKTKAPTPPAAEDPAVLARQATAESALAMRQGRYADAQALAALADSYARMAERQRRTADAKPLDAAGEEALRQDLLKRLDALAAEIAAEQAGDGAADPFTPAPEPAICGP